MQKVRGTAIFGFVALKKAMGLSQYKAGDEHFTAIGDERGLLLVMKRGRNLSLASPEKKAAGVFRMAAHLRGGKQTWTICMEAHGVSQGCPWGGG